MAPTRSKHGETEKPEPTNTDIYNLMMENNKDQSKMLSTIIGRLDGIEKKIVDVEDRVTVLENAKQGGCTNEEMRNTIADIKKDIVEERRRISKQNNLVVFGINEDEAGEALLKELMEIVTPGEQKVDFERFGETGKERPRALRLYLRNIAMKRMLLGNLKKLKGLEHFRRVSVQQDLTVEQIKMRSPYQMRTRVDNAEKAGGSRGKGGDSAPKRRKLIRKEEVANARSASPFHPLQDVSIINMETGPSTSDKILTKRFGWG